MRRVALLFALALVAPAAIADEGEVALSLLVQPEAAWVSHPLTSELVPFAKTSSFTFLPRVGAGGSFGLTDSLTLGVGVDGSAFPGILAKGVKIENTVGDLVTGTRLDLMVPVTLGWRLDSGFDASAIVELSAGPVAVGWLASKGLNPDLLGENGLPTELPGTIEDAWRIGAFGRAAVLFDLRLGNWFLVDAGVSATVAWAETMSFHVGLVLRPSFIVPLGSL